MLLLTLSLCLLQQSQPAPGVARGVVFEDTNNNRRYDVGEAPLAGVRVSNGRDITRTGADGSYRLPIDDDTILFVVKPRGYRTPLNKNNLPQFYYVHKPGGSPALNFPGVRPTGPLPESVDFPLYRQEEPKQFHALLFGDTQPRNQKEVDWIAHDVVEELVGTKASFGVTLGDIVFDDLKMMRPLNRTIALLGIPWYNIVGNHDINYDAKNRRDANETFESVYGPSYYSFDYGPVHFLAIDNIEWRHDPNRNKMAYRGGIGKKQLEFIRNDLALVPADQLVVLMMHIPLTNTHDRHGLYRLIEKRKFCMSISGHTHHHEHVWIEKKDGWNGPQPHHHVINVTVCGSWWSGAPDERGIPHATMADGAPNGYSVISFDGSEYKIDFRAAGRPKNYQIELHAPEVVREGQAAKASLFANVFNGSARTRVEMRVGGAGNPWIAMKHAREIDPKFQSVFDREADILGKDQTRFRQLPKPKASSHLWRVNLPAELAPGTHRIDVRATDHHQRVVRASRVLRCLGKR